MFNKNLATAVSKDIDRYQLSFVNYDNEEKCYVATNGHILMVEYTDDQYDSDKFFSPRTGLEEHPYITFPNWKRIIPEDGEDISERDFSIFVRKEKSRRKEVNKVLKIKNFFLNFEYMYNILKFIGTDYSLIQMKSY